MSGKLLPFINFNLLAWVCFPLVYMGKFLMMTMTTTTMMILCTSFSCVDQSDGKYNFNFDDEWVGLMKIEIKLLQVELITMGSSFMNPPI